MFFRIFKCQPGATHTSEVSPRFETESFFPFQPNGFSLFVLLLQSCQLWLNGPDGGSALDSAEH